MQALFKYDRDQDAFIEELADVIIVTRQLMETLDDEQEKRLDELIEFKLNRTLERLKIND